MPLDLPTHTKYCLCDQARRITAIKASHDGPGVFDDFKFLFDPAERSTRSTAQLEQCASAFMRRSGIPNIIGAIDGPHIRVAPPKRHQKSYYNRK